MLMLMVTIMVMMIEEQSSVPQEEASRIGRAEFCCYRTSSLFGILDLSFVESEFHVDIDGLIRFEPFLQQVK
jgi:hypothetical protein